MMTTFTSGTKERNVCKKQTTLKQKTEWNVETIGTRYKNKVLVVVLSKKILLLLPLVVVVMMMMLS
jgi:hypothetical protein